jgi:hypothetical protein
MPPNIATSMKSTNTISVRVLKKLMTEAGPRAGNHQRLLSVGTKVAQRSGH